MEKVIRNGKVAVLVSSGYGAGWSTWNSGNAQLLFHPTLIEMVESGRSSEITTEWVEKNLGISNVYVGGTGDLEIVWVEEGTRFLIQEYDGAENLLTEQDLDLHIA